MSQMHLRQFIRRARTVPGTFSKVRLMTVVFLLTALLCLPTAWAAPLCGSLFAQNSKSVICHDCCAAAECCAIESQHGEARPVDPATNTPGTSGFDANIAISPADLAFL